MADNTVLNPGTAGDTVRDLARQSGTVKTQVVQLDLGGATANAEVLITAGQQTMALSVPVALASNQTALPTKAQDGAGTAITSLADGAGQTGLGMSLVATNFVASAANSSTAQLATTATFTGTIETIFNQQAISILLTADQTGTLTLNQYIDLAGTRKISAWVFTIAAGVPFSRCFVGNGNYFNLTYQNTGAGTTTTLNINTAYGTLPNTTNLGNQSIALNEVNGTAISLGQTTMAASLPVALASNQAAIPVTATNATAANFLATVTQALGTAATRWFTQISDGTNSPAVKAASTAAAFTDPSIAVSVRPGEAMVSASAALADALANPTLGQQAVLNSVFNGTSWDRQRGMGLATTTGDTGAKTATGNGATITNIGNKGVDIVIVLGTVSGTTPTCVFKVQSSVDGGTNWTDVPGAVTASLVATGVWGISIYPGAAVTAGTTTTGTKAVASQVLPRTWRMVWTIGGTTPSFAITSITYNYIPN